MHNRSGQWLISLKIKYTIGWCSVFFVRFSNMLCVNLKREERRKNYSNRNSLFGVVILLIMVMNCNFEYSSITHQWWSTGAGKKQCILDFLSLRIRNVEHKNTNQIFPNQIIFFCRFCQHFKIYAWHWKPTIGVRNQVIMSNFYAICHFYAGWTWRIQYWSYCFFFIAASELTSSWCSCDMPHWNVNQCSTFLLKTTFLISLCLCRMAWSISGLV